MFFWYFFRIRFRVILVRERSGNGWYGNEVFGALRGFKLFELVMLNIFVRGFVYIRSWYFSLRVSFRFRG